MSLVDSFFSAADELYQLFVVFHDEGFGVYEPGHCHIHHVVKGDFKLAPRDDVNGQQPVNVLCGQSNATSCVWGAAVNVKNRFIYVTQPDLHRVVVVEVQDRLNPVEVDDPSSSSSSSSSSHSTTTLNAQCMHVY